MFTPKLLDDGELTDYAGQLEALGEKDFVEEISSQILHAGYSSRQTPYDQRAGAGYKEAERRGAPWLYQRAYNRAAASAGIHLDPSDYDRAKAPPAPVAVAA